MPSAEGVLLRGVDRAAFVVPLGARLRAAGVPVTVSALAAFTRALAAAPPADVGSLYWLARVTLVNQPHQLAAFDAVFQAVFADAVLPVDPQARRGATTGRRDDELAPLPAGSAADQADAEGLPWHTRPRVTEAADETEDTDDAGGLPELLPSAVRQFADTPFDELDAGQLALLGAWLERSLQRWPTRRSRRQQVSPHGRRVAMRETIARSRRTGWEPMRLSRSRPVQHPRRVVLLADVSRSMEAYATAYLHLLRAFARSGRAETFAFSTSLTRVTPALAQVSAEAAIAQATAQVVDRYGGTHLATSLRDLLRSRHGNAVRGAVLVVASDGWDSDPPERLVAAMERVRRRAHRIVWLNPRAAAPGFAPLVGSMAAALPFCDVFLPAHTLRAMPDVFAAVTGGALSSRG
ncbi:MAG: vWA domain-containing protein [Nocardioidaceae bacterium]